MTEEAVRITGEDAPGTRGLKAEEGDGRGTGTLLFGGGEAHEQPQNLFLAHVIPILVGVGHGKDMTIPNVWADESVHFGLKPPIGAHGGCGDGYNDPFRSPFLD